MRFNEAITDKTFGPLIVNHTGQCIKNQRQGISYDNRCETTSQVWGQLMTSNPEMRDPGWKTLIRKVVLNVLARQYRDKPPEINETAMGDYVDDNGNVHSKLEIRSDEVQFELWECMMAQPDPYPNVDAPIGQWLNYAFKGLISSFRALNENPECIYEGDPHTTLPILDAAATAHLKKPAWGKTWFAIWQDIRTHAEPLNERAIARRCHCNKNTVEKAATSWMRIAGSFQQRVDMEWNASSDKKKIEWLHNTLNAIKQSIVADITKLQHNLDTMKWGGYNKPPEPP